MPSAVRTAAVAGRFYPRRPDELLRDIRNYSATSEPAVTALGCVAPHAGYMYSGHVAGAVYARLEIPQRSVILCPNHTGMGHPLAAMTRAAWQTPLGEVAPDPELGDALLRAFSRSRRTMRRTVPNMPLRSSFPSCRPASRN